MIGAFESMVRQAPQRTCFTYVDEEGGESSFSCQEVRMMSASVARDLQANGAQPGNAIVVDLPNSPLFVFLILAAAYGGYTLIILNNRLTDSEKRDRLRSIERRPDIAIAAYVSAKNAEQMYDRAVALLTGEYVLPAHASTRAARAPLFSRGAAVQTDSRPAKHLRRAGLRRESVRRREAVARQDAFGQTIHFAEHAAHMFDAGTRAIIMFTSGTTGRAKAVPLTWNNLCRSAKISNALLNCRGEGLWQAVLPMYHIGGFQVIVRSVLNGNGFVLYHHFNAAQILEDAERLEVTHISVVDKMLQDMLASAKADALKRYTCILLGGGAVNYQTLERANTLGARVYASYGMTETSSQIAHTQVTSSFQGGLRLLPGYNARIVDPDEDGFGRLAVKGPGLFESYLNARAAYTVDNYFLTGDIAALYRGFLYIKERTSDMFVSGGENVYPAEITRALLGMPAVTDAYVFGAPDKHWGRRPVAFVELAKTKEATEPKGVPVSKEQPNFVFAETLRKNLEQKLSKLYIPKHLFVLDELPRKSIGKVDREALDLSYEQRIEIARIVLHRIRLPFKRPFSTSQVTLRQRESIIVEVVDYAGRTGLGECVAFPTAWYLPETLDEDEAVLRDVLAPLILHKVFLHPREVHELFATCPEAALYPLACGALEPALWDLYGKIVEKPLWQLIGGQGESTLLEAGFRGGAPAVCRGPAVSSAGSLTSGGPATVSASGGPAAGVPAVVPAAAVVGLMSVGRMVAEACRCAEAGYRRVKLKVEPGCALACARAVRKALPDLMISLDANQSFTEQDAKELRNLDACNISWIEEPLNPHKPPASGPADIFSRLACLQQTMQTPICLDESIVKPQDINRALAHPELTCYAVKIGKFGGIQPALDFIYKAHGRGIEVWMGGMYDTGISKRMHAAFETLDFVRVPGDIGPTGRYFTHEITDPPYTGKGGLIALNCKGHIYGLGCDLNRAVLSQVLLNRIVVG